MLCHRVSLPSSNYWSGPRAVFMLAEETLFRIARTSRCCCGR